MKLPDWIWPIVAGILVFIITKLWNKLVAEHLRYVRCRLRDLGDAAHRLQEMKDELLHMDAPLPTSESISSWIQKVQDLQHEVRRIDIRIGSGLYDSASAAYYLGRKLVRELKKANDLAAQGKYFLQKALAKRMRSSSSRYMMPLQQRHLSESRHLWGMGTYAAQVHDFVESRYDSHLLIWGMRGVGKSALLRAVRDSYAAGGASFHHVLFIGAGNGCTVANVQNALATSLGLDTDWPMMSSMFRGRAIFNHLKDKNDRVLLLLDDVEETFDSKDVGFRMLPPWRYKVIMAARSQAVRADMLHSADNTIQIRCLEQDDAWNLFKCKVGLGIIDAHPQVHRLAKQMVAECRGLPLSLCVIGRAMSSKTDAREWRNAYNLLKAKHSQNQEDEGYSCLDVLENELNDSFLVTSLWPKDGSIPREGRDAPRDHILAEGELNVDAEKVDMPDHLERLSDESAGSESDNHKDGLSLMSRRAVLPSPPPEESEGRDLLHQRPPPFPYLVFTIFLVYVFILSCNLLK